MLKAYNYEACNHKEIRSNLHHLKHVIRGYPFTPLSSTNVNIESNIFNAICNHLSRFNSIYKR